MKWNEIWLILFESKKTILNIFIMIFVLVLDKKIVMKWLMISMKKEVGAFEYETFWKAARTFFMKKELLFHIQRNY